MRKVAVVLAVAVAAALAASPALAKTTAKLKHHITVPSGTKFYTPPSPLPGKRHGDLIWSRAYKGAAALGPEATNTLLLYRSTGVTGKAVAVSGLLTVPPGYPPKGGWPIITWAHGTTGIADQCAPSRDANGNPAHGNDAYIYPLEQEWMNDGFAVLRTDYEGLGTPGVHPYLNGNSEGRSVLDIVRAARQFDKNLGKRIAIAGHSQGGQGALFAASLVPKYTPELKLLGTVAFAPVSHLEDQTSLLSSVAATSLSGLVGMIFRGIDVSDPTVNVTSLLTPHAAALYPQTLTKCLTQLDAPDSFGALPLNQFLVAGADTAKSTAVLTANDAAVLHIGGPVLIEQGLGDTTVFPQYTMMLQGNLTANGVNSTLHTYDGVTHGTVVTGAPDEDAIDFIAARFGLPKPLAPDAR
jgi:pimeloyl-ACP methyl ester carboxylesterase